jgi:hypothetical protein
MKEIAKVVRRGCKQTRVRFTDDTEALVPTELAVIGQEIDELRLVPRTSNGKKVLMWAEDNSHLYKRQKSEKESAFLDSEIWKQFYGIVEACASKFTGFKWVSRGNRKVIIQNFTGDAALSGIVYRMSQRSQDLRGGYVYSCFKGCLINRHNAEYKERHMFVSLEDCENVLLTDGSEVFMGLES